MTVQLVRGARLFPGAPYAYAAKAHQPDLIFTAGACPLDEQGQVIAPADVRAQMRQAVPPAGERPAGGTRAGGSVRPAPFGLAIPTGTGRPARRLPTSGP